MRPISICPVCKKDTVKENAVIHNYCQTLVWCWQQCAAFPSETSRLLYNSLDIMLWQTLYGSMFWKKMLFRFVFFLGDCRLRSAAYKCTCIVYKCHNKEEAEEVLSLHAMQNRKFVKLPIKFSGMKKLAQSVLRLFENYFF